MTRSTAGVFWDLKISRNIWCLEIIQLLENQKEILWTDAAKADADTD